MGQTYLEEGWMMTDEFDLEDYLNKAEYFEVGVAYAQEEFDVAPFQFKEFI